MTKAEAHAVALKALNRANEDSNRAYAEMGEGWGAMDSDSIFQHIAEHLAHAFGQGPKPAPL